MNKKIKTSKLRMNSKMNSKIKMIKAINKTKTNNRIMTIAMKITEIMSKTTRMWFLDSWRKRR